MKPSKTSSQETTSSNKMTRRKCSQCSSLVLLNQNGSLRKHTCNVTPQQPVLPCPTNNSILSNVFSTPNTNSIEFQHLEAIGISNDNLISIYLDLSDVAVKSTVDQYLKDSLAYNGDNLAKINELIRLLKTSTIGYKLFLNFESIEDYSSIAPDGLCTFRTFQSLESMYKSFQSSIDVNSSDFSNEMLAIPPTKRIYDTNDFSTYLTEARKLISVIEKHSNSLDPASNQYSSSKDLINRFSNFLLDGDSNINIEGKINSLITEQVGSVIPFELLPDPASLIHANYAADIHNLILLIKNAYAVTPDAIRASSDNWYCLWAYRLQGKNENINPIPHSTLAELLQTSVLFANDSTHTFIPRYTAPAQLNKSLDDAMLHLATSLFNNVILFSHLQPLDTASNSSDLPGPLINSNNSDPNTSWLALRSEWLDTLLINIPGDIIKQFFCSFAGSEQYIPKQILGPFRECLSYLLQKAEDFLLTNDKSNSEKYYIRALILPSIILTKPSNLPSGFTRNTWHLYLLSEILKDNWTTTGLYLKDIPTNDSRNRSSNSTTPTQNIIDPSKLRMSDKRAINYMDNNLLSMAMDALQAHPLAPPNLDTFIQLQNKHPTQILNDISIQDLSQISNLSSHIDMLSTEFSSMALTRENSIETYFTPIEMRKYTSKAKKKKAPGNSNLRFEHLKQLISNSNSIDGDTFLTIYTRFCSYFAAGRLPTSVHSIISEGSIFGITKPDNSIRPVVVKDSIAKTISLPLRQLKSTISDFFFPVNLCHSDAGIEKVIHTVNKNLINEFGLDSIFIDIKNAHNSVFRDHALNVLREHFPIFVPYFLATYGSSSSLYFDGGDLGFLPINSSRGFHQGDPFASFIFGLSIQSLLVSAKQLNNDPRNDGLVISYEDDITVQNSATNIIDIFNFLKPALNNIGLEINLAKTKIFMSQYNSIQETDLIFNRYLDLGLLPSNIIKHFNYYATPNDDFVLNEAKSKYGILLLGSPIGSDEFITSWLHGKISALTNESSSLSDFRGGLHRQYTLLSHCFSKKINHLLRTVPTHLIRDFASNFDALLLTIFNKISDCTLSRNSNAHIQMMLPISFGGLGLGNNVSSSYAAFIASEIACFSTMKALNPTVDHSTTFSDNLVVINNAIAEYNSRKHTSIMDDIIDSRPVIYHRDPPNNICSSDSITPDSLHSLSSNSNLQKYLSVRLHRLSHTKLLSSLNTDSKSLARLVSCSQHGSGLLFTVCPKTGTWSLLSDEEIKISILLRLGVIIPDIPSGLQCTECKSKIDIDLKGEHFLNCPSGGARLSMHNQIVDIVSMLAKATGSKVQTDKLNHLFSRANSESSPDIQITQCPIILAKFNASNPPTSIFGDIRIVHPACKTYCNQAASTPFFAANRAYTAKMQKFSDNMSRCQPNAIFIPLILEIFGAIHPKFREFLAAFVPELAMKMEVDASVLFGYFLKKISTSLARCTSRVIISHRDRIYFRHPTFRQHGYPNAEAFNSDVQLHVSA